MTRIEYPANLAPDHVRRNQSNQFVGSYKYGDADQRQWISEQLQKFGWCPVHDGVCTHVEDHLRRKNT